jgi:hypothetical protein
MAILQAMYEDMNEDGDDIDWNQDFEPIHHEMMTYEDCTPTSTAHDMNLMHENSILSAAQRPDNPMFEYISRMIADEKIRMTLRKRDIEMETERSPTQASMEYSMHVSGQSMMRKLKSVKRSGSANSLSLLETLFVPKTLFPKPVDNVIDEKL